jgi:pilus assembly protein Flp/PilA
MVRLLKRFGSDDAGATAIEYGLIASLIAMVLLGAWAGTGNSLSERFNNIAEHVKK